MKTRAKRLRQGLADAKQGFADARMTLVTLMMPVGMKKQIEAVAGEKGESFSAFMRFAARDRLIGQPAFGGSAEEIQQTVALVKRWVHQEAAKMARGQRTKYRWVRKGTDLNKAIAGGRKTRKGKQLQNE